VKEGGVTVFDPNDFKDKNKGVSTIRVRPQILVTKPEMIKLEGSYQKPLAGGIVAVIVIGSLLLTAVAVCLIVPCVAPESALSLKMQDIQVNIKESMRRKKPLR